MSVSGVLKEQEGGSPAEVEWAREIEKDGKARGCRTLEITIRAWLLP